MRLRVKFSCHCNVEAHRKMFVLLECAIQSKTKSWSAVNLKKLLTSMSSKLEPAIWSRGNDQRIPCFDRCQLTIPWMPNLLESMRNKGFVFARLASQ